MKNICCVILAAGEGTRMKSRVPKVLHPICGRPMIAYTIDLVKKLGIKNTIVVLGHKEREIRKYLPPNIKIAVQKKLLGTADALKSALSLLKGFKGTLLVLYADNPLLTPETVKGLLKHHRENNFSATLLTANLENPSGYGRILRDKYNCVRKIVEEGEANDFEKEIKEINTGIMCFAKDKLISAIAKIRAHNKKKEYYLTDAVEILYKKGEIIGTLKTKQTDEVWGVNSQEDLAKANNVMRQRILK
ncbi:MAG: NTP transferase domain-containing protein, partial [Candidatus Omnitrophica bacterium]|nr:NTP transferase domain-containing protein [Candidatus Omnitrophota bacterium]